MSESTDCKCVSATGHTRFDPACPFHGDNGTMVVRISEEASQAAREGPVRRGVTVWERPDGKWGWRAVSWFDSTEGGSPTKAQAETAAHREFRKLEAVS